jgi:hypothetical protein
MRILSAVFLLLLGLSANAQETVVSPTINTYLLTHGNPKQLNMRFAKSGEQIELPFVDDFSTDRFPGNEDGRQVLWMGRQATRNYTWAKSPPTIGVVSFDGANEVGFPYQWTQGSGSADTLESCPINLDGTSADNFGISFYYQPKGFANLPPNPTTDSLILELYAPELDQWFWAWSTVDISDTENFTFVYIPITNDRFFKEEFKFRFRNIANLQGAFDLWHLDYVWLDRNSVNATNVVNDVAFTRQEPTVLKDYTAIPLSHFALNPASHMVENISVLMRNLNDGPRTLEGNRIRILHEGVETGNFLNSNSPAIFAQTTLEYTHSFGALPNQIVLDPSLDPDRIIYEVEFTHAVSDFVPTTGNDTMRVWHEFFTHYAYDDGSAEAGYFVAGTGSEAAIRYTNLKNDSIWALQIYTMPSGTNYEGTPMSIRLYEDAGNTPGNVIAEALHSVVYGQDEYQQSIIYKFDEPVFMESGTYFAGYRQSNQSNSIIIGLDFNTSANPGRLYFKQGPSWAASSVPGSIMIRPMYTTPGYQTIASTRESSFAERLKLYPNPANELVYITFADDNQSLAAEVYDIGGRLLMRTQTSSSGSFSVAELPRGVYVVKLTHHSGATAAKKLVVTR